MIKHFCNSCGGEMTEDNDTKTSLSVEVAGYKFKMDAFCLPDDGSFFVCKYCLIKAVNDLDDRLLAQSKG